MYSLFGSQVATEALHDIPIEIKPVMTCVDVVNSTDEYGGTALYRACFAADEDMVAMLLKEGADPNIIPSNGAVTPLYVAAHKKAWGIVSKLLKAGADPEVRGELDVCLEFPDDIKNEFGL